MIFLAAGLACNESANGLKEVGEWRSLGATKNAKFAKASNLRKTPLFDFDSKKPTNRQNLLPPWHSSAAKKELGNPDKDPGVSSEVHWATCCANRLSVSAINLIQYRT